MASPSNVEPSARTSRASRTVTFAILAWPCVLPHLDASALRLGVDDDGFAVEQCVPDPTTQGPPRIGRVLGPAGEASGVDDPAQRGVDHAQVGGAARDDGAMPV